MAFADGYVPQEAREAMTLSAIAYQGEGQGYEAIKAAISSALGSSPVLNKHFTLVWLGISGDFGNLLYVARDDRGPARYALVSRGTDWNFLVDWVDDFDVLRTHDWPYASPADTSILVAQGSWDGLQALRTLTSQPDGATLGAFLRQIGAGAASGLDLLLTGHSLGGALATILGLYLADTVGDWRGEASPIGMKSYTFASPTTGDRAYADYYNGRSALSTVSWQAFRVYNEQDVVPFAYADIEGIPESGIPLSPLLTVTVAAFAGIIRGALKDKGVSYTQVGNAKPLSNTPPGPGHPGADPAMTLDDFASWVGYEHSSHTYLSLLGAPTGRLEDHSLDMSAITSRSQGKLETRLAAARAQLLPLGPP